MRSTARLLTALALFALLAGPVSADDWPRFLGINGDSISAETGINKDWNKKPPAELWRFAMSDDGYSGPAAADGIVYLIDHREDDEIVRALDLVSGEEKWRYMFAEPGKPRHGYTRATPTVADGVVYTVSRYGTVTALDAAGGDLKWKTNLVEAHDGKLPRWHLAGSAVIDANKLIAIAGGTDAHVVALNKATGREIWAGGGGSDKPGYATPVIATLGGVKQYLVFTAKSLVGVAAAGGTQLWSHRWQTKYDVNAPTPRVVDGERILLASGYRGHMSLLQYSGKGLSTIWDNKRVSTKWHTPVILGDHIYVVGEPGFLICLELATGEEKWRSKGDKEGFGYGGICAIDGTLIVVSGKTGNVVQVAASPDAYTELGRLNPLDSGKSWTAPIVADKKLIVRSPAEVVCLDLAP